ncbi:MAG TPA: toxin-antitoxin system HicB family antitoxin [Acetobacteraceae bacterium]|jgi:predicted HicB family RNase H-like nuclease|nr:toxin-antitoxin system HicB family antitoxin [Acetobacteraceae bacterium]
MQTSRKPRSEGPRKTGRSATRDAATDHFTYRVSWSEEDQEFAATCAEFPSLSHLARSQAEAIDGLQALIADVLRDMAGNGESPPEPLAQRRFSGEFVTRVPGELHRLLTIEAAEAGVSLNRLVSVKLAIPLGAVGQTGGKPTRPRTPRPAGRRSAR